MNMFPEKSRQKCVHNIFALDIVGGGGSCLMILAFSFNKQSSIFLKEHFQAPEAVKAMFQSQPYPFGHSQNRLSHPIYFSQATSFFSAIKVPASKMFEHLVSE